MDEGVFGWWVVLGCAWLLISSVINGYPVEDIIVGLRGQPKVSFRQFAGYIDVDVKAGRSLFYYFVEAQHTPQQKPLTLWLNGGISLSLSSFRDFVHYAEFLDTHDIQAQAALLLVVVPSQNWDHSTPGVMVEHFERIQTHGTKVQFIFQDNTSNLLFVESPAGVGWSYSNMASDYTTGDAHTAKDMHVFLMRWLKKFPEYKTRDLFLTGESYAGHYIPQLAVLLLSHSEHSKGFKFNVKGVAIGNPLLKLDRDIPATYEYFWSHGMISDEIGLTIMKECDLVYYSFVSHHNVSEACISAIARANQVVGDYIDNYDVILDVCYPSIVEQDPPCHCRAFAAVPHVERELRLRKMFYSVGYPSAIWATKTSIGVDVCMSYERRFYFNLPEVQKALHANRTNLPYAWSMCSSGDQDSVVPRLGSRTLMRELAHDLKLRITVSYGTWFHKGQVGGWQIEYGNLLTLATVRGAAHMVPYAQPSRALHLFSTFVHGRRLPNNTRPSIDNIDYS
ncbi:hypothetical protein Ancab_038105 [Ancistrocladus abbreviatus]